jgi:hypothetical protein
MATIATSTTKTFLKDRVSTPTLNKWSSGFTACKNYAEKNNLPLIGVWSNGDKCSYCTKLEKAFMQSTFKNWMATSKCVFWFGCGTDTSTDDKMDGTGFTWARKKNVLTGYPFVRVYWAKGGVDFCVTGRKDLYGSANTDAARGTACANKFKEVLAKYYQTIPATTPTTNESSDNCPSGDCGDDCCDKLEEICKQCATMKTKLNTALTNLNEVAAWIESVRKNCEV